MRPKQTKLYCGKPGIRPDHPRRRIKIKFCMLGSLRSRCKFQLSSKSVKWFPRCKCGGRNLICAIHALLWQLAYTTGCTTIQTSIESIYSRLMNFSVWTFVVFLLRIRPASSSQKLFASLLIDDWLPEIELRSLYVTRKKSCFKYDGRKRSLQGRTADERGIGCVRHDV